MVGIYYFGNIVATQNVLQQVFNVFDCYFKNVLKVYNPTFKCLKHFVLLGIDLLRALNSYNACDRQHRQNVSYINYKNDIIIGQTFFYMPATVNTGPISQRLQLCFNWTAVIGDMNPPRDKFVYILRPKKCSSR